MVGERERENVLVKERERERARGYSFCGFLLGCEKIKKI